MPVFLIFALISLALGVASQVLANIKRQKGEDAQKAGDLQVPTAEAGKAIPVFFGTAEVATNLVWYGNVFKAKRKQWFYSMSAHLVIGWGVVNEIVDILWNDKSSRNQVVLGAKDVVIPGALVNADAPLDVTVLGNAKARSPELSSNPLFGGDEQQGGVGADYDSTNRGRLRIYWGFDDATRQPFDTVLQDAAAYGLDRCSRWPGLAYIRLGHEDGTPFYIAAGSGTPASMKLIARRTAWWDGATSPLGQTATDATIRYDASAPEILYALLTHPGYGIGRDPASIDLTAFAAVAAALLAEEITPTKTGFGISVVVADGAAAESIIQSILEHVGAVLATDPLTTKLTLRLVRFDYTVSALPVIDPANARDLRYAPQTWGETYNEVTITYRRFVNTAEKRGFVDDAVTHQDLANFQAIGRIRSQTINLPFVTDPDIAALCCARTGRALSVPLAQVSWRMNRQGYALKKGDVVVANWPAFAITGLVVRITHVNYGSLEDGEIEVAGVEDVFAATQSTYTPPATTDWTVPTATSTDDSGSGSTPPDVGAATWGVGFY